jgi:hypothetical protein
VKAARAVRAMPIPSLPGSFVRIQHGQTNQKLTCEPGYNKNKNALKFVDFKPAFLVLLLMQQIFALGEINAREHY